MPYKGVSGKEEWIIAGHQVTINVNGKVVKQNHMIDAKIKDGKVELFYVYAQNIPAEANE
jgi:type 1 fimbria pilin